MKIKEHSEYWRLSSLRDWKTSKGLFELKRYDSCLFFCHLTLEKLLKGIVILHTRKNAPFIHDLERLSFIGGIQLSDSQINHLKEISAFNIAGRYSDYKFDFYKKCNRSYTQKYLLKTELLIRCLKKKYPKI